jgi:GT2 family glycosyltransferase
MVSIIILNYNTFELTCKCIESIYKQTQNIDFEIILVDNASTEKNPDKFLDIYPEIKLIKNTENKGFSRGCNDGIEKAIGDYILLLNSDTVLLNNAISIVYNFLKKNDNIGIASCRLENIDGSPQNNCQIFPSLWKLGAEKFRIHKLFSKKKRGKIWFGPYFNYSEIAFPDWVWGTFFMFPHKLLNIFPNKKLPETFWMYIEDMEWCWIARKNNYKVAFVPDARVLHLGGGVTYNKKYKQMINENYWYFVRTHYGKLCYLFLKLFIS